jgi:5-methylcytosine-specific restriction endonuclease McrA
MSISEKRCSKCGEMKPLDAFYKEKRGRDGLKSKCKLCHSEYKAHYNEQHRVERAAYDRAYQQQHHAERLEYRRAYREIHREERTAYLRNYRAQHREKIADYKRVYDETHRHSIREYNHIYDKKHSEERQQRKRMYYETNRERMLAQQRAYYQANREKKLEQGRLYREENRNKIQARNRLYRRTHPEVYRAATERRRSRRREAEGSFTTEDIKQLYQIQGGCCAWCSVPLERIYQIDHIVPLSRNGSNWSSNLVLACARCNSSKNDKVVYEEWEPPRPLNIYKIIPR